MNNLLPIDFKEFVRIVKNTHILKSNNIPYEKIKKIILAIDKPMSNEELHIKNFSDTFLYLLRNINTSFNTNLIIKTYYILTNQILNEKISKKIVEEYYLYNDESPHFKAIKIHECIIKNIYPSNIEMAIMFANYVMIQDKRRPLIVSPSFFERYKKIILNTNVSIKEKQLLFIELEVPYKRNRNNVKPVDCKEMCMKLFQMKKSIESFGVQKLYIFGSVAKRENTVNSDLDLLVKMNENIYNFEKRMCQIELNKFLEKNLNIDVDVVEFSHAVSTFDMYELESIITVF